MNKFIGGSFIFIVGFGAGAYYSYIRVKEKYDERLNSELDQMKLYYEAKKKEPEKKPDEKTEKTKPEGTDDIVKLAGEYLKSRDYTTYSNSEKKDKEIEKKIKKEKKEDKDMDTSSHPDLEVISPDEFDTLEDEGYMTETLYWYEGKYLADSKDELIDDVNDIIGWESLNHIGEYEEGALYVRNHKLKIDFEVLVEDKKYEDVVLDKPYLLKDDDLS